MLVLFAFAAAFPSVARSWLRAVLVCLGILIGILNVIDALYQDNEACWECGGQVYWLFKVVLIVHGDIWHLFQWFERDGDEVSLQWQGSCSLYSKFVERGNIIK